MFTLGAAWGTAIEIGGEHVGVVGGTMNSIGNLVAMLNPLIVAYSVEWFGNWDMPLKESTSSFDPFGATTSAAHYNIIGSPGFATSSPSS
jgi:hypothetical protein